MLPMKRLLSFFLLIPSLAFGALSANTTLEVRPGGNDLNGGGFVTGATGTDYSVQDAAQFSGTDLASANGTSTSPVVTSGVHNFVAADVGNIIQITAGASWMVGFYQIVSVASNAATLDRACGTAATLTVGAWAEGGALASIGQAGAAVTVAGMRVFVYNAGSTVYSITSATNSVSGGCFNPSAPVSGIIVGYATNRTINNTDPPPTIQINVGTATIFGSKCYAEIRNLILDGNNQTNSRATFAIQSLVQNCLIKNFTGAYAISGAAYLCKFTSNTSRTLFGTQARAFYCEAYANTATPFNTATYLVAVNCLSYNNTGATTDGFAPGQSSSFYNCVAYGNGRYGFSWQNGPCDIVNCISENNAIAAFNSTANTSPLWLINFAYDNGFTFSGQNKYSTGVIHYTGGSVFVNAAGGNFALNNIAGRGALLRQAGFATFPTGTTVGYPDIGAAQSKSP